MIDATNQNEYRAKFIKDIEEQAWRKRATAAFDETKIPEVEVLRQGKLDGLNLDVGKRDLLTAKLNEVEAINVECAAFPGRKDRTDEQKAQIQALREKQAEIKKECEAMEKDIARDEDFIVGCDETIAMIQKSINEARTAANQLLARAKFAVDFTDTIDAPAEAPAEIPKVEGEAQAELA